MSESTISNKQKQSNYREQFKRLKKALNNGFNLEAVFIEYAIIEDRCNSILRYEGMKSVVKILFPLIKNSVKSKKLPNKRNLCPANISQMI